MANDDDKSDQRHSEVARLVPPEWDARPLSVVTEIRTLVKSLKDEGTSVDSGTGDGYADLWITIDGIEYFITVRRSNKQLAADGKL